MNPAIGRVEAALSNGAPVSRDDLAAAARAVVAALAAANPGNTIEVRVPPFAAGQVGALDGAGPTHRRGTPPNVVELAPETAVRLATGALSWEDAVQASLVRFSGAHASDVGQMLPLLG
ncbi:MAG: sterol carrier family protein [Propionibacteriaceae bacterium]|nr:sterol carrier family protein [Propionibacteriaceae bacterium]